MNIVKYIVLFLLPASLLAQGPVLRQPATTNLFMNSPSAGDIMIWNGTAGKWSNGVFAATATNLPAYAITNNWNGPTFTNRVAFAQVGNQTNSGKLIINTSMDSGSDDIVFNIESTDADQANRVNLFRIAHVDSADSSVVYALFISDSGGAPTEDYKFGQTDFTVGSGIPVTFLSSLAVSGPVTNSSTFRQVGAAEFRAAVTMTNGAIVMGQDSIPITFGGNFSQVTGNGMTNWYPLYQMSDIRHDVGGVGSVYSSGAQALFQTGTLLQLNSGARLELDYLTANRVMITGAGSMATNHPDMRLAVTLSGAANGEVLGYHAASGTWTNQAAGTGTPVGPNGAIQVAQGGAFWGTNSAATQRFGYDITNGVVTIQGGVLTGQLEIWPTKIIEIASTPLYFGSAGISNWNVTSAGHWSPTASNTYDVGSYLLPVRTNYNQYSRTKQTASATEFNTSEGVPGAATAAVTISATNRTEGVRLQGAHQMSVLVTNIVGLLHKAFASVIEFDASQIHEVIVTNRVTGVSSIIFTNLAEGQLLSLDMFGEIGGSSRVITLIPNTGFLALDGNNPGTGPALNLAFTLTNGNKAEISGKVRKVFGATNYIEYLVNQSKF